MLKILRYEKIVCESDESIPSNIDPSKECSFVGVHSESIFSFMEYFVSSRKLCFLWSPCFLLVPELISLDTSGKPTVEFFLKYTSPSWIILSITLDELNSVNWLLKSWIFLKFHFIVVKKLWYGKKYYNIRVFWRLYLNIIFWVLLWRLTSLVI